MQAKKLVRQCTNSALPRSLNGLISFEFSYDSQHFQNKNE